MKNRRKLLLITIILIGLVCILSILLTILGYNYLSKDDEPTEDVQTEQESDDNEDGDDLGSFEMTPEDCFPQEKWDPDEKVCYIECDSEEECERIEKEILDQLGEIGDDYFEGDEDYQNFDTEEETTLITYKVVGDSIQEPSSGSVSEDLKNLQEDTSKHNEIWTLFATIIPSQFREDIVKFEISTDGKEGALAGVYQDEGDLRDWVLVIDIVDAYDGDSLVKDDLIFSLVHEYGHVLTLNSSQVTPNTRLLEAPSDEEAENVYEQEQKKCEPSYFTQEGCTFYNSYLNQFFQKFWDSIFDEWQQIEQIENEDEYYEAFDTFYQKYQEHFVTDYAATNPEEDIAESWTYFVLKDKPTGNSVSDQKVNFFYNFDELVRLRDVMKVRIYSVK